MQKLVLEFVKEDYSSYTLAPLLVKFMSEFLGLETLFKANLSFKKRFSQFSIEKLAFLSVLFILLGMERFSHVSDKWIKETGLAKVNGLKNFPKKTTLCDFLNLFTGYQTEQLKRVHKILLQHNTEYWMPKRGPYFIDVDLNTKSVEGKKIEKASLGYNKKRRGRLCLQWSRGLFCGMPFWSKLHSGNTNSIQSLKKDLTWIKQEITAYSPHALSQLIVRLDGGYWSPELLKNLDYPWLIHGPMLKELGCENLIKDKNTEWKIFSDTTKFIDIGRKDIGNNLNVRVLLIKQRERSQKLYSEKAKVKYIYYVLMANLYHWSAKSLIKVYRGRQIIENHFKETNQAFFSNKLPSGRLRSNEAFLWFVTMAYTISSFFKRSNYSILLPANELQKLST